ncbi:MAG: DUF1643 domain-containing protein [Ilumatobacteraceae bacterium]
MARPLGAAPPRADDAPVFARIVRSQLQGGTERALPGASDNCCQYCRPAASSNAGSPPRALLETRSVADDYDDRAEYSEDTLSRWWWERRWSDGPGLCWVGLNPSTGDTTGRPRPTLRKVVALAKAHHLNAVTVVNLFSWRATKPADLKRAAASHDIVGGRTDGVIAEVSGRSPVTLAAWGSHGSLRGRSAAVVPLLSQPMCLGTTASGQPRHPLYVRAGTDLLPYADGRARTSRRRRPDHGAR